MTSRQAPRARRRLGQHFLSDPRILEQIAELAELTPDDTVLEIGPGTGALTRILAQRAGRVVAVEIDERMRPNLEALCSEFPHVHVIWGDFLKLGWDELWSADATGGAPPGLKIVANIPYYITTPILLKILQVHELERRPLEEIVPRAKLLVLMVQEEVGQRLRAAPGSKDYGSLSVLAQYASEVDLGLRVPRRAFVPVPKVDSAVVRMIPRAAPPAAIDCPRVFFKVVRGAFGQRRKTLMNALLAAGFERDPLERAMAKASVDPRRRGETLSLAEFASLAFSLA